MWFLYALALFAVLGKLLRPVPVAVQLAASGVLSALAGAGVLDVDSRWVAIARFLFFFLLGWHGKQLIEGVARASSLLKVVGAAVACVAAAGGAVVLDVRTVPGVAWALNCLAVAFGVLFAAWISRYAIGRPLVALGRLTLPIYLIHMLWLAVIVAGIRHLDLPTVAAYALPVVITIALVGLSLMTHGLLVGAGGTWLFALPSRLTHRPPAVHPVGRRS
jgi:peptidoglycan/LPS O-acetylase OafA/YrhL